MILSLRVGGDLESECEWGIDLQILLNVCDRFGDAIFFNLCGMQLASKHTRKSDCTQVSLISYILKSQGNGDNASDKSMCVCVCVCVCV